ncbi:Vacuolar transporter chaperone 1 [Neolecta irregularis DAH-3]|uniref:Vacuolar transporter chaperone 1 n=1 Tax=Neolecta irregularis (strain DAH-3) TaxID=1198029 RepID=A0A1U7LR04_NEOID|nr:Vacuolar transporter chaperone 1 [Neolecta irregularis DAH-3]|eukprot:OLL25087.1 Vacuolar transporter chaperone 1 [Neolecta irregularis DAH-3]
MLTLSEISVPVRIEPKVYLANERTVLEYMQTAIYIGAVGTSLMNFGDKTSLLASAAFTLTAIVVSIYSTARFLVRAIYIRRRRDTGYIDRFGPTMLCLLILISLTLNFWLRLRSERDF